MVSTGNKECPAQGGMLGRATDLDNGSSERVCGKEKRRGYGLFLTEEGMQHQKRGWQRRLRRGGQKPRTPRPG